MRLVRMDDFPHGDRNLYEGAHRHAYKKEVPKIIEILERHKVYYMLGVSPLICTPEHLEILHSIEHGKIVMHGFNHAFSLVDNWNEVTECWKDGGEFSFYSSVAEIKEKYEQAEEILYKFRSYDPTHFIPPFNCYNQKPLDALQETNVQFIHGCDQEWFNYGQGNMNGGRILPIISQLYNTYDDVTKVIHRLNQPGQITLHWACDIKKPTWAQDYEAFAKAVTK